MPVNLLGSRVRCGLSELTHGASMGREAPGTFTHVRCFSNIITVIGSCTGALAGLGVMAIILDVL